MVKCVLVGRATVDKSQELVDGSYRGDPCKCSHPEQGKRQENLRKLRKGMTLARIVAECPWAARATGC